jgi:wyosine [tRNA(Phe)-imidazoG37] synthetase (radical SAM superfamily)
MGRFTFGPVPSRRLGFSLGVDLVPRKRCTFDCIYCQVGKSANKEVERRSFFNPEDIVGEIVTEVKQQRHVDVITFSGSGEPTLNLDIGWIINETKKRLKLPVSVITNSSLLVDEKVRFDLTSSDLVLPSLDAVSEDVFLQINRPHPLININDMIQGLKRFKAEYKGKVWLEIMLVRGINDDSVELEKMKEVIAYIGADKIQLNTVTRPPAEEHVRGLSSPVLKKICTSFGSGSEIICKFKKKAKKVDTRLKFEMVSSILSRRSLTIDDIVRISGVAVDEVRDSLREMKNQGRIRSARIGGATFYQLTEE